MHSALKSYERNGKASEQKTNMLWQSEGSELYFTSREQVVLTTNGPSEWELD